MLFQSLCGPLWTSEDNGNLENVSGELLSCGPLSIVVDLCGPLRTRGTKQKTCFFSAGIFPVDLCGPLWTTADL